MFALAQGISIREFARRDGCSDTLVRRAIKSGALIAFADGSLDELLIGTIWRQSNRDGANSANSEREQAIDESAAAVAARLIETSGAPYSRAEAERIKENYLAGLRRLEFEQRKGSLLEAAEVARAVGEDYASVRRKLLAIPAERAAALFALRTVAEVEQALRGYLIEALEDLCRE